MLAVTIVKLPVTVNNISVRIVMHIQFVIIMEIGGGGVYKTKISSNIFYKLKKVYTKKGIPVNTTYNFFLIENYINNHKSIKPALKS